MDHRTTSIKFLRSTGLHPVKVRPGQKDPFPEWDPRRTEFEDANAIISVLEHNKELNLGALFAGRYADLDNDGTSPALHTALDYFLPRTSYIWGRHSKPRSHRVFALHDDFERGIYGPVLRYINSLIPGAVDGYSYKVEIRGGKRENGLFSVLPGSKHPSGEMVEWDSEIDPTVGGTYVETAKLIKAVRLSIVSAILAPHWQEGVRNDLSLALAGTLWRIRAATMAAYGLTPDEEAPAGYFVLEEEDAEGIFNAIMKISGDDENDKRSRLLNLKNTWRKLYSDTEAKVTGGKVLAELLGGESGTKVARALYRLLSDNDAAEEIEKLVEQYVMWYGPGMIIDLELVRRHRPIPWMTKEQASNSLSGKKIKIGDKKVPIVNMLFGSPIVERVYGLTFDPSTLDILTKQGGQLHVNQWAGFELEPATQRVTDQEIEPFLHYVKNILACGDQKRNEWILAWTANIFQTPAEKTDTALVLVGPQGAGKSFLGTKIIGPIIGDYHYAHTDSMDRITQQFNTLIDNKLFLQCDEATHSSQRAMNGKIKSMIDSKTINIEPKGVNIIVKPNRIRLLFTSNEEHSAVFIDPSPYERRFTVLKVSSEWAKDVPYWTKMHEWIPMARPKIMRWLMDYKYDPKIPRRVLDTVEKRGIQRVNVDMEVSWILSRVSSGFLICEEIHDKWWQAYNCDKLTDNDKKNNVLRRDFWPNRVSISAVEEDYKRYARSLGKQVFTAAILTNIKRVVPEKSIEFDTQISVRSTDPRSGVTKVERPRIHTWPGSDEILAHLKLHYGGVIDELLENINQTGQVPEEIIPNDRGNL